MRILIVSPTPTHPPNAGNRVRVLSLAEQLLEWGHDVEFLHVEVHGGDHQAMLAHWGHRYHSLPYRKPPRPESIAAKLARYWKQLYDADARYQSGIDDWYIPQIDARVSQLHAESPFQAVITEYVFLSRALLNFGEQTLKIIDTHDVLTDRHRMLLDQGLKPYFFSTSRDQEAKGLDRADLVIAIQEHEAKTFAAMTRRKVITVAHLGCVLAECMPPRALRSRVLFVGSNSTINADGIRWFVQHCWEAIRTEMPAAELVVAGAVSHSLPEGVDCVRLGHTDNLERVYASADVVINPVQIGRGLNIKSAEALGYGMPLVASAAGARGLESAAGTALLLAHGAGEFAAAVQSVLRDDAVAAALSKNALDFARRLRRQSADDLYAALVQH